MEHALILELDITKMCKMNAFCDLRITDDLRQIVFTVATQTARTECKTIVNARVQGRDLQQSRLARHDARQAENAPRRIIRMYGHLDLIFLTGRHDTVQEIFEILHQALSRHACDGLVLNCWNGINPTKVVMGSGAPTGDATPVTALAIVALASLAGVVALRKKEA